MADVVAKLDETRLEETHSDEDESWSIYDLLHGIVQHDVYHAGQIGMLKKTAIFPTKRAPLLNATSEKTT